MLDPSSSSSSSSLTYSLISLFLQLQNPSISFIEYKKLCKEYDVKDFVKVTEKKHVFGYFLKEGGSSGSSGGGASASTSADRMSTSAAGEAGDEKKQVKVEPGSDLRGDGRSHRKDSYDKSDNRDRDRDRDRDSSRRSSSSRPKDHHRHDRDRHEHRSSTSRSSKSKRGRDSHGHGHDTAASGGAKKKEKKEESSTPITHQQLLDGLKNVVVKRAVPDANTNVKQATDEDADNAKPSNDETKVNIENDTATNMDTSTDADPSSTTTNPTPNNTTEEPPQLLSPEEEERRAIQACLSASGYEATKLSQEILEKDRMEVEKITNFEIPVGDSGSILRCGAMSSSNSSQSYHNTMNGRKSGSGMGGNHSSDKFNQKNFIRVLHLLDESKREAADKLKHGSKYKPRSSSSKSGINKTQQEKVQPKGNPIIIVPNAMTSPITLLNALPFFQKASFITRDKCKRSSIKKYEFQRNVSHRYGGGTVTYEIIDNPKRVLKSPSDWARVVAVLAQGESWQFKGWKMGWVDSSKKGFDTPVEVFSNSFGFFVGYESAPIPQELLGWQVKKGFLSRDKRGLDSVVYASFWNGLDEWMSVHKRSLLPK
jgi:hypothetical protein